MKKLVYISLPISGTSDYISRGQKISDVVIKAGYTPILPYKSGLPKSAPYLCHIIMDTFLLLTCNAVIFDKNWWGSKGCKWEYKVAVWARKEIITKFEY